LEVRRILTRGVPLGEGPLAGSEKKY